MTIPASLRMALVKPRGPFTPALDPRCVCGDVFSDHERTVLSVTLRAAGPPLYALPTNSPIADKTLPGDTADVLQCHCGCTVFAHDHCEYKIGGDDDKGVTCRLDFGHRGEHLP